MDTSGDFVVYHKQHSGSHSTGIAVSGFPDRRFHRIGIFICGSHTYSEIIEAVNSAGLERFSLQSDGINGTPQQLWEMVGP